MTLYMIGTGLNDEKDITIRGMEIIKKCGLIYLESYTSKLNCPVEDLERLYQKKIIIADRELIEKNTEEMLEKAKEHNVAFLVIGDVFSATTHTDLRLRALGKGVKVSIIHNASILTAIGDTGLELYKFGRIASIPFANENISTPYDVLETNQKIGLHTLFLLDIDSDEKKCMAIKEALEYLLHLENKKKKGLLNNSTLCVCCGKLGAEDAKIKAGTVGDMLTEEFPGLQCLIIPGKLHFIEEETLKIHS